MGNVLSGVVDHVKREFERAKQQNEAAARRLDQPYCSLPFDQRGYGALVQEIANIPRCSVLLCGPVGVGKSSYMNTIASCMQGRFEMASSAGRGVKSFTTDVSPHVLQHHGRTVNWTLIDSPGDVFDGMVEVQQQSEQLYEEMVENFERTVLSQHNVGCVLLVLSATDVQRVVGLDSDERQRRVPTVHHQLAVAKLLHHRIARAGIRMIIVLTKCDLLDPDVSADITRLQYSRAVRDVHTLVSQASGVPHNQVLPLVNMVREYTPESNPQIGVLALFALRAALYAAGHIACNDRGLSTAAFVDTLTETSSMAAPPSPGAASQNEMFDS